MTGPFPVDLIYRQQSSPVYPALVPHSVVLGQGGAALPPRASGNAGEGGVTVTVSAWGPGTFMPCVWEAQGGIAFPPRLPAVPLGSLALAGEGPGEGPGQVPPSKSPPVPSSGWGEECRLYMGLAHGTCLSRQLFCVCWHTSEGKVGRLQARLEGRRFHVLSLPPTHSFFQGTFVRRWLKCVVLGV